MRRRAMMRYATWMLASAALSAGVGAQQLRPHSPPAMTTAEFVQAAAESDHYEVQAARVAIIEGQDPKIRAFAQQMIAEHSATSARLGQAAAKANLPRPDPTMSADQQRLLAALQGLTGAAFDKAYATQQVLAHTQALVVEQGYAVGGADPIIRQIAQSALPMIRTHLAAARRLSAALGPS